MSETPAPLRRNAAMFVFVTVVLDAVDGPSVGPNDPVALAAWFSGHIEASDLLLIGERPPSQSPVPVLVQDIAQPGL